MIGVSLFFVIVLVGVSSGQNCGSLTTCSHQHKSPVCGSNGVTYSNYCYLTHAICIYKQQHRHLALAHSGSCHHATSATHIDLKHCDLICDEEHPTRQVCLSNGQTYASQCDANNAICNATHSNGTHLSVVSNGPCLDLHSSCVDVNHQHTCPHTNEYVCATNGYTYANECYLRTAQCRLLSSLNAADPIEILHEGKCKDNSTAQSRNVDCTKYADMSYAGSIPVAVEGGVEQIVKINHCNHTSNTYVCADGFTYGSECSLCHRMATMHKITYTELNVAISYDGRCHHQIIIG
ncbi:ovoinhibitor-like [Ruditapes philippinarum]|uniref:ovoinhibitor-like n=1 Tax=Ruditapes philippinarum TaxID=129788 RepID=UPI00295B74BD|nr:ovoinhibitor-like [Ruditapes philippinarum]